MLERSLYGGPNVGKTAAHPRSSLTRVVGVRVRNDAEEIVLDGGVVARIPATVSDAFDLMTVLARELRFPEHFGENWDALHDCLRDLSWLSENRVVIYHEELPKSIGHVDLATYLDILLITEVRAWKGLQALVP